MLEFMTSLVTHTPSPTVLPIVMICAVGGGLLMVMFTRWLGVGMLIFNVAVLFVGAYFANVLTSGLPLYSLDRFYGRPIVMSVLGMALISIPLLMSNIRVGRRD